MNGHRKGFSLVEIMVGMAMGMIAMIVIMQVFTVFEADKRTTTSGADAQTNGAVALFMIERDVKVAGWGMEFGVYKECETVFAYCDGSPTCGGVAGAMAGVTLASVMIADGGDGPDTITSQYYANPETASFDFPGSTKLRAAMSGPEGILNVQSKSGCKAESATNMLMNSMALVKFGKQCTVMRLTPLTPADLASTSPLLRHDPTPAGDYNPPADYMATNGWPAYATGAEVTCFSGGANGPIVQRSYSIDANRQLLRGADVVASDIVDLQAEYGIIPVGKTDVEWVPPTGAWANPSPADRTLIKAVRIALVARSTQYEKPDSGSSCKTTTAETIDKWSSWATFNTAAWPSDWQCYRYKAYETIVPLRNIISGDES